MCGPDARSDGLHLPPFTSNTEHDRGMRLAFATTSIFPNALLVRISWPRSLVCVDTASGVFILPFAAALHLTSHFFSRADGIHFVVWPLIFAAGKRIDLRLGGGAGPEL